MERHRNGLDFLRDGRGIHGLGFRQDTGVALIMRPDKFRLQQAPLALQAVPSRPRIFRNSVERSLADRLHRALFEEAARLDGLDAAGNLRTDGRLRRKFYGCRDRAYRITNALIRQLLAEAGDEAALRRARRFRIGLRQHIYSLAIYCPRLSQLCDTFPLLAVALADESLKPPAMQSIPVARIVRAVRAGRRLRQIAALADIPYVLRAVPPLAAWDAYGCRYLFARNPHLIASMPSGGRAASPWFATLWRAWDVSPEFAEWCAKRLSVEPPYERVFHEAGKIGEWAQASHRKRARQDGGGNADLVTRPFDPAMAAGTARRLSEEWHDAVRARQTPGDMAPFPLAWVPEAEINGYRIAPVETPLGLEMEARAMHNCAADYLDLIRRGLCCLYSVRKDGRPVATIGLRRDAGRLTLARVAGPWNTRVDQPAAQAVRRWAKGVLHLTPDAFTGNKAF